MNGLLVLLGLLVPPAQALPWDDVSWQPRLGHALPLEVPLTDSSGHTQPLKHWLGDQPAIAVFQYFHCSQLCPETLARLRQSLQQAGLQPGRDFRVLGISMDPDDTPQLAAFAKSRLRVREGWWMLTAGDRDIHRLTAAAGFGFRWDSASRQYAHPAGAMVLTPRGVIARYLTGVAFPPTDLRLALTEASQGRIGGTGEQILLYCFRYDPATGRYGPAVLNVVRAAALATLLLLILLIRRLSRVKRHG